MKRLVLTLLLINLNVIGTEKIDFQQLLQGNFCNCSWLIGNLKKNPKTEYSEVVPWHILQVKSMNIEARKSFDLLMKIASQDNALAEHALCHKKNFALADLITKKITQDLEMQLYNKIFKELKDLLAIDDIGGIGTQGEYEYVNRHDIPDKKRDELKIELDKILKKYGLN